MLAPFFWMFDTTGFVPRWTCGVWTAAHGWTHIVADLSIFLAYAAIPTSLAVVAAKAGKQLPFSRWVLWLFVGFIASCGLTHLIEAMIFYQPLYRLGAVAKVITAGLSWATVFGLLSVVPHILEIPELKAGYQKLSSAHARQVETTQMLVRTRDELERRNSTLAQLRHVTVQAFRCAGGGVWRADPKQATVHIDLDTLRDRVLAEGEYDGASAWRAIEQSLSDAISHASERLTPQASQIAMRFSPGPGIDLLIKGGLEFPNSDDRRSSGIVLWIQPDEEPLDR